jgi:NDP-sugar pyrophosphorylase family protein
MDLLSPHALFDLSNYRHSFIFTDCRYVWEVLCKIEHYLRSLKLGAIEVGIPAGAHLIHPDLISIGKGSVVEPGAYIKGPCIIGENCTVRQGAYIRGKVIVGDSCVIGHDTEMKNALMLNQAHAAHFAYAGDCVIGNRVNLGAGVKCANLRLDRKEIVVHFEGKRFQTHLTKWGAILGDDTQIGCNSVANPGTITGKQVVCYPCVNFGGVIPAGAVIQPAYPPKVEIPAFGNP